MTLALDVTAEQPPYDRFAAAYRDWWGPVIAPSAVALLDRLDGLLPSTADGDAPLRMLDIGAGTGTLALAALERWPQARVVGVDPSGRMLELAEEAARRRRLDGRLEVRVGEAAKLPLPDASVDAAITSFVIQLTANRTAAIREARRVLRPGGVFACVTWRADDEPFEPAAAFEDAADELGIQLPDPPGRDPRPYASATAAAAELRRVGFRDVRAREEWLEHRFTPNSYLDILEHWIEDDTFSTLDAPMRQRLRAATLRRLERLPADALVWRRPLVSVVGRRPVTSGG